MVGELLNLENTLESSKGRSQKNGRSGANPDLRRDLHPRPLRAEKWTLSSMAVPIRL